MTTVLPRQGYKLDTGPFAFLDFLVLMNVKQCEFIQLAVEHCAHHTVSQRSDACFTTWLNKPYNSPCLGSHLLLIMLPLQVSDPGINTWQSCLAMVHAVGQYIECVWSHDTGNLSILHDIAIE